nr:hypothetical protein [Bacilli bacterium]
MINILWLSMLAVVLVAAITDYRWQIIPNRLVRAGVLIALVEHTAWQGLYGLGVTLAVWALCLIIGFALWRVAPVGAGDIKLLAMMAAFVGAGNMLSILILALVLQLLARIIRARRGFSMAFAPALMVGSLLVFWYLFP